MKTYVTQTEDIRCGQFGREFKNGTESERTTYLALREAGDSHCEASEVIRAERALKAMSQTRKETLRG